MDHRGDLYSVGIILYELLTGRTPFEGNASMDVLLAHATEEPPTFKEIGVDWIPAPIEKVVRRCLAKVPEERPASARDLAEQYQAALAEAEQPDPEPLEALDVSAPDTVPETPSPLRLKPPDDPNAIAFYLEAWMPEAIAVHKLRGFVHDVKGEVVQSVPGLIRVRLGGSGGRYRFRSRRKSWLDLALKSGGTDMALYMEQAGPSASLLNITVQMRSQDGVPASDEDFQAHCSEVFVDLRAYLMAQNINADDSIS